MWSGQSGFGRITFSYWEFCKRSRYSNRTINTTPLIEQWAIGSVNNLTYFIANFSWNYFQTQSQMTKFSKISSGGMCPEDKLHMPTCSLNTFLVLLPTSCFRNGVGSSQELQKLLDIWHGKRSVMKNLQCIVWLLNLICKTVSSVYKKVNLPHISVEGG